MNPRMTKLSIALAQVLGIGLATSVASLPVMAQQPAAKERIEVTGSNIKRVEGEGALPVTVITREEIEKTGATTAMELLQLVSSNTSSGNVSIANVIGSTTFSGQTASLRGLGGGRTLVLINGKRVNGFAGEIQGVQGVNLAVIPFAAIDRVEILKDGASAVYGSDAIGGVINFILRSDYRGAEASVWYGAPTRTGGGTQEKYAASAGFGDLSRDRYNFFLAASYDKNKHLEQKDRDFSRSSINFDLGLFGGSSNTFPGRITTGAIGVPGQPNCAPSVFVPELGNCYYDPSADTGTQMIPDQKTTNIFASGKFQITSNWQAYGTALYSKDENNFQIQPVPISNLFSYGPNGDIPATITIRPTSPFYPTALAASHGVAGQPLNVRYRAYEAGHRNTTDTNEGGQVVAGIKGSWGRWDVDAAYTYAEGKTKEALNGGFPLYSRILPLLNSGRVNLFGFNTPAIQQELQATNYIGEVFSGKSTSQSVQGKISGEIMSLPAGSLAIAIGGEARKEKLTQTPAPVLATGDLTGFGGNILPVSGDRDVNAIYGEVNIPILKTLEANLAVRTDDYSDFGRTTNPKASLRWQPTRDVLLRSSYGKGFLAPSLYQLFTPNISGVSAPGTTDPIRCPVTHDTGLDCATQFPIIFGGNKALKPEKSEQATFGIVFEPTNEWSFSADYFKIRLKNTITNGLPVATILGDLGQYGNLITRGPADPAFPNLPGRITGILQTYINLGSQHLEGMDLEAHFKAPRGAYGRFRLDVSGTYYIRYDSQNLDGSYSGFVSNQFGAVSTGVVPRYKQYAAVTWDSGPWTATLANTYQSGYVDVSTDGNDNLRRASSMSLWDLQGSFTGFKGLTLTLGVKNVLDTNPPQTNQQNSFQVGFDPSYYDPRARFVYGMVKYEFK
jgi:iron complex outermembrane receptor protein